MKKTITTLVLILVSFLSFGQYVGEIRMYAGSTPPSPDWEFCEGQILLVTTHPSYVDTVGSTYGGDGVNSAGVPDMRGRVPVGQGTDGEFALVSAGQKFGTEDRTPYVHQTAQHLHKIGYDKVMVDEGEDVEIWNIKGDTYEKPTKTTGASIKVNKHQPSLGIRFIIKVN